MEHRLITGGHEYLPFARSCITKLKRLGLPYASQSFEIGGASIKVRIEPGHEYIRIEGGVIYMESGILDLGGYHVANRLTYLPAKLRFTPEVARNEADVRLKAYRPNAKPRKIKDADISWSAAGCSPSKRTNEVLIETMLGNPIEFTSDTADFCEPMRMLIYKTLMLNAPASIFTGKLKLMVQAIYGSKRTDYIPGPNTEDKLYSTINLPDVPRTETNPVTEEKKALYANISPYETGLITYRNKEHPDDISKFRYMLVTIRYSIVHWRELTGEIARNPGLPDELAEALQLSTLEVSKEKVQAIGTGLNMSGDEFFAYGWHFTKDGHKASAVRLTAKDILTQMMTSTPTVTVPNIIGGYSSAVYTINFVPEENEDGTLKLSYSVSSTDHGEILPLTQHLLLRPGLVSLQKAMVALTPTSPTPWEGRANVSGPVYCFYDKEDKLIISRAVSTAYEFEAIQNPSADFSGSCSVTTKTVEGYPLRTTEAPSGVSIDGVDYLANYHSSTGVTIKTVSTVKHKVRSTGRYGGIVYGVVQEPLGDGQHRTVERWTDLTEGGSKALIVPFNDASACVGVLYETSESVFHDATVYVFGGNTFTRLEDMVFPHDPLGHNGYLTWGESFFANYPGQEEPSRSTPITTYAAQWTAPVTAEDIATAAQMVEAMTVPLVRGFTTAGLHTSDGFTNLCSAVDWDAFPGLWITSKLTGWGFLRQCTVLTSYGGSMTHSCWPILKSGQFDLATGKKLWPDGIGSWTSSVGWA